jgi:hypothetical protein
MCSVIALGMSSMLATVPAGAEIPQRTTVVLKTPLNLLGAGGTFLVMANETRTAAGVTAMTVVFRNGQDAVLKRVSTEYAAGRPAVVGLKRAEVPGSDPFAVVWVEVALSRPGDFSPSRGAVAFKLVDGKGEVGCAGACNTCPREVDGEDVTCAPPEGGRHPEFSCPDGSAHINQITVLP